MYISWKQNVNQFGAKLAANSIKLQNYNHLCPPLAMELSIKPADKLF